MSIEDNIEGKKPQDPNKCINCNFDAYPKPHKFKNGLVCNTCFLGCNIKQINKWNDES